MENESVEYLLQTLHALEDEHADLNKLIDESERLAEFDEIMVQRLKKRKLLIKDLLREIQSKLYPDIIA